MMDQLMTRVQNIFAPYKNSSSAQELEEELLQNLTDKFRDFKQKGYSEEEAYQLTVDSIGDVDELIDSIRLDDNDHSGMKFADLSMKILRGSDFRSVSVHNGKFNHSDLRDSDFSHSDLSNSTFHSSNLQNCIFEDVNLTGVSFGSAHLKNVVFKNNNYYQTHFKSCDLSNFKFDGETLKETIFSYTSLKKTSFRNATILHVQFRFSDVTNADFTGAKMDKLTYNVLKGGKAILNDVHFV
ncbi:pentapeptide repeat-containing protein [Bacillus niameyensis]|uniref:pentapeptide repeat-containing protein n=1 Tax=Bacillus niameyensis TaxID=1522308 RepID=UPI0007861B80|nr:pentapeptide repeat-containing protein [Bacillus niameyensis]